MTETERRPASSRKATLLLLASGVAATVITLGFNVDLPGLFQGLWDR